MTSGIPLTDVDRWDWLDAINKKARSSGAAIFSCSALKESYREILIKDLSHYVFIHLQGEKELILKRMEQRQDHFMPSSLLDSQFDSYENPSKGYILKISEKPQSIVDKIENILKQKSEIGVIGLGVMGTSIARNIGRNEFSLSIYNRHVDGEEENVAISKKENHDELKNALAFDDLKEFVNSLSLPRKVLVMVNAGKPVDSVIDRLTPLLSKEDIIIDGGNSNYNDTQKRYDKLKALDIHFIGSGVSGGEQGALMGPSIMPGGDFKAYQKIENIFTTIAATSPLGSPCCNHIGKGGAGHFVKMVHNGIEYGEMQLIAECYALLRYQNKLSPEQISAVFTSWSEQGYDSYLLDITIKILLTKVNDNQLVLDTILDKAGNKGTGAWTTIAASELGVAIPTITAALFARYQSFFKNERKAFSKSFPAFPTSVKIDTDQLMHVYQSCRILNHHQGINLIKAASIKHDWKIDLRNLYTVWTAGCIIRSSLLLDILKTDTTIDFLQNPYFSDYINSNWVKVNQTFKNISESALPAPAISASIQYFKSLIQEDGNANMIQAQRDFFGAHTYKLKSDPYGNSHHFNWPQI